MFGKTMRMLLVAVAMIVCAMSIGCNGGGGRFARHSSSPTGFAKSGCSAGSCGKSPVASASSPTYAAPEESFSSAASAKSQRTCPVTGEELGSMGGAIPVKVKGETILVCCQGCVKKVQQNPDKYLAKVHAETRS